MIGEALEYELVRHGAVLARVPSIEAANRQMSQLGGDVEVWAVVLDGDRELRADITRYALGDRLDYDPRTRMYRAQVRGITFYAQVANNQIEVSRFYSAVTKPVPAGLPEKDALERAILVEAVRYWAPTGES